MDQARKRVAKLLVPGVTAVVIVGTWAILAATVFGDRNFLLPRPADVLKVAIEERSFLWTASWATFTKVVYAFCLAALIGITSAAVLSQSRLLTRSIYPYAVILQTVPILAVAPIILLWFSYGRTSIVIIAVMISFFPIFSNTLAGLASTDQNQLDLCRLHRVGRLRTLFTLRFPSATPSIAAGLRISAGMAVIGSLVGEYLVGQGGARGGLGVAIIVSQAQLRTALLFAEAALATILGLFVFFVVDTVASRALRNWHESAIIAD